MFTSFPSVSTIGNAETLLSTNFLSAKIMLVSSVAVSMFSKVPILSSLSVLLMNDGFGNSWIYSRVKERKVLITKQNGYINTRKVILGFFESNAKNGGYTHI